MLIEHFEKKIQKEIDPRLRVQYLPRDVCGVYLGHIYLNVTLPRRMIFDRPIPEYRDKNNVQFRSIPEAMAQIKHKLNKYL